MSIICISISMGPCTVLRNYFPMSHWNDEYCYLEQNCFNDNRFMESFYKPRKIPFGHIFELLLSTGNVN